MSNKPTGDNLSEDFFTEWRNWDEAKYRLSQAAPDMLAALQAVVRRDRGYEVKARAAIAKATGGNV